MKGYMILKSLLLTGEPYLMTDLKMIILQNGADIEVILNLLPSLRAW